MSLNFEELDRRYVDLVQRMDDHIERLNDLQIHLEEELGLESEYSYVVEPLVYDTDEMVVSLDDIYRGLGSRVVRFEDEVDIIPDTQSTIDTTEDNYTPFEARRYDEYYDSDDPDYESDTDTVVLEWSDPARSPDYRDVIRHR